MPQRGDASNEEIRRVLERRAGDLARTPGASTSPGKTVDLVTFSLSGQRLAVEMPYVREVRPLYPEMWSPVPCTPNHIVGAANIRGRIFSIMTAAPFLDREILPPSSTAHLILLVGNGPDPPEKMELCLLADERPDIESVLESDIEPMSAAAANDPLGIVLGSTGGLLTVLDAGILLSSTKIVVDEKSPVPGTKNA